MAESTLKPMILVDMAKNRIRVHRATLETLHFPEYVLLIVNPAEKTIGIMPGKMNDPGAHRVKTQSVLGKNCYELYSTGLTRQLRYVCDDWLPGGKYLMVGFLLPGERVVCFPMENAEFKGIGKVR